ncbi:MAG: Na(+)-translocating NADH-quinone reductase subunit A [Gammaproteobacteria bacterium]|nr:MAG: Na(+)-translocating NADH-quinone reductase subunit A [Gammaproteobacteria bacterium]
MQFRVRRGLDIPIDGAPDRVVEQGAAVRSVALLGADYVGLEPRMLVQEGDQVVTGQPLLQHKRDTAVVYPAPGSGTVSAIHRGARRVLKSVVIDLDRASDSAAEAPAPDGVSGNVRSALLTSGLWTAFRTRPFSRVPHSEAAADAVFVTAMDSRPLAADPLPIIQEQQDAFTRGLEALTQLGDGPVFLCTAAAAGPLPTPAGVQQAGFSGPHPAGLPGTHIHHLYPVGPGRSVWHIGYQDVIAIGHLLDRSVLQLERVVALGGTGFQRPRLVRTRLGASIEELTAGECVVKTGDMPRLISGSVLEGRAADGSEAWLGRHHVQVTALPQPRRGRSLRWAKLFEDRFSFAGAFASLTGGRPGVPFDADQNGRATALVPLDALEKLMPMDMLAEPLLRALLVGDTDQAQALGALELDEEDLALCSFVCPGKNDYGSVLRINLDTIEREG